MGELLTPKEVARYCGVNVDLVYDWLRVGRLEGMRTSAGKQAHWRVPFANVLALAGEQARRTAHPGALRAEDV